MKRIISLLLCIIMLFSSANVVFADEAKEDVYNTVSVEFSDNMGTLEKLQVMVKDDNVYANAEELGKRLGYDLKVLDEYVAIYNQGADENVPYGLTVFYYDSTKVGHMLFSQMVDSYEAPFETIKNENGVWIPLEYSLLLLNSSMLVVDNTICIDMPSKNIVDIYTDILKSGNKYYFDWNKDFGYTELEWLRNGLASHCVNMLNGLLDMDGATWLQFVQTLALDNSAYDSKYSEAIAELFCTYSDKELEKEVKHMKKMMGYFDGSGTFGKVLSTLEKGVASDDEIGELKKVCQKLKDNIDGNKSSLNAYNRAYQVLENATSDATFLFDEYTNMIAKVQKEVKNATGIVGKMFTIAEVVGYAKEFQNQDEFAVESLMNFVGTKDSESTMSNAMKSGIEVYTDMLQKDILTYSAFQYLINNYDSLLMDAAELSASLGTEANLLLIGWDLVQSANLLNIGDKIDAAEQFELATYGTIFESDAFIEYQKIRDNTFSDIDNITSENLYEITQSCYAYLKFCYITRDAAIASLKAKTEDTQEKIQPLIEYQNAINEEIAGYLVQLKKANATNKYGCYGFLPGDNVEYLKKYEDENVLSIIETKSLEDEIKQMLFEEVGMNPINYYYDTFDGSKYGIIAVYQYDSKWMENDNCQVWYCDGNITTQLFKWENESGNAFCNVIDVILYRNSQSIPYLILNTWQRAALSYNYCQIFGKTEAGDINVVYEVKGKAITEENKLIVNEEVTKLNEDFIPETTYEQYQVDIIDGKAYKNEGITKDDDEVAEGKFSYQPMQPHYCRTENLYWIYGENVFAFSKGGLVSPFEDTVNLNGSIAIISCRQNGNYNKYYQIKNSNKELIDEDVDLIQIAMQGKKIVYRKDDKQVILYDISSKEKVVIAEHERVDNTYWDGSVVSTRVAPLVISPDGNSIVYSFGDTYYVYTNGHVYEFESNISNVFAISDSAKYIYYEKEDTLYVCVDMSEHKKNCR